MATTYPSARQTFTNPNSGDTQNSPSHSTQHTTINDTVLALQDVLGTTNGTSVLKTFAAGDFALRVNTGGTLSQTITKGTANNMVLGTPSITGGTLVSSVGNGMTLGTPVIGTVALSGTVVPLSFGGAIAPTVTTLADPVNSVGGTGTIACNSQLGQVFNVALGTFAGLRVFTGPLNPVDGVSLTYRIKQNVNNTGTVSFAIGSAGAFRFVPSVSPALGTQSTVTYLAFRYNGTDSRWDTQGSIVGII